MTVPRSVADVLADHVTLEVESIDRISNLYVPQLQHVNGVVQLLPRTPRGAGGRHTNPAPTVGGSRGCVGADSSQ
jgi:hypothetical protein